MKLSKETFILIISLSIVGLVGVYSDFFLSLNAYKINPTYFVKYETNQEIVNFFSTGEFPIIFLYTVIAFPFIIFLFLYKIDKYKDFKYRKDYVISVCAFVYLTTFTRISAGLTWYYPTNTIMFWLQAFAFISLGFVVCFGYILHKEAKNESKN